jgi:solute carrier family 25 carnitine/acylcarnitine transporter 20/29
MNETLMEVEHTPPVHKRILDIMPGVSGGVARIMVGQPFDTIKTRLQVLGKGTIGAAGMPPEMVYTSGMDCVKKMVSAKCLLPACRVVKVPDTPPVLPAWQALMQPWQP